MIMTSFSSTLKIAVRRLPLRIWRVSRIPVFASWIFWDCLTTALISLCRIRRSLQRATACRLNTRTSYLFRVYHAIAAVANFLMLKSCREHVIIYSSTSATYYPFTYHLIHETH